MAWGSDEFFKKKTEAAGKVRDSDTDTIIHNKRLQGTF